MAYCLVTPASRGIGHALTKHLLTTTKVPVVATARKDTDGVKSSILDELQDVDSSRLTVLELDVTEEESVKAAASKVKHQFEHSDNHLRLAFAIPGILHAEKSPAQIDYSLALQTFKINTLGPMLLMKHFCQFLPRKATHNLTALQGLPDRAVWGTMAARVGSTTDNVKGGWYSYRASKAGVVSLAKTFDLYLQGVSGERAVSVALHPGTVKTGLSRDYWDKVEGGKLFAPELAAKQLCEVVNGAKMGERGLFLDWQGKVISP